MTMPTSKMFKIWQCLPPKCWKTTMVTKKRRKMIITTSKMSKNWKADFQNVKKTTMPTFLNPSFYIYYLPYLTAHRRC
jgi:hypothetical protein